jgi:hypothetical protein
MQLRIAVKRSSPKGRMAGFALDRLRSFAVVDIFLGTNEAALQRHTSKIARVTGRFRTAKTTSGFRQLAM